MATLTPEMETAVTAYYNDLSFVRSKASARSDEEQLRGVIAEILLMQQEEVEALKRLSTTRWYQTSSEDIEYALFRLYEKGQIVRRRIPKSEDYEYRLPLEGRD